MMTKGMKMMNSPQTVFSYDILENQLFIMMSPLATDYSINRLKSRFNKEIVIGMLEFSRMEKSQ